MLKASWGSYWVKRAAAPEIAALVNIIAGGDGGGILVGTDRQDPMIMTKANVNGVSKTNRIRRIVANSVPAYYASVNGGISRSTDDGATWPQVLAFSALDFVYANGSIWAPASSSAIRKSTDGITWSVQAIPSGGLPNAIATDGVNRIVIVNSDGQTTTSSNGGSSFTFHNQTIGNTVYPGVYTVTNDVIFDGVKFWASYDKLSSSSDGIAWTLETSKINFNAGNTTNTMATNGAGHIMLGGYGNGRVWFSNNYGATFTMAPTFSFANDAPYNPVQVRATGFIPAPSKGLPSGGLWIVDVAGGGLAVSEDGLTFRLLPTRYPMDPVFLAPRGSDAWCFSGYEV